MYSPLILLYCTGGGGYSIYTVQSLNLIILYRRRVSVQYVQSLNLIRMYRRNRRITVQPVQSLNLIILNRRRRVQNVHCTVPKSYYYTVQEEEEGISTACTLYSS